MPRGVTGKIQLTPLFFIAKISENGETMTKKTHIIEKKDSKHSQTWEWEETPELIETLKKLRQPSVTTELKAPNKPNTIIDKK